MTEWNKELERRILKKSRFTLTFRILRLLLLVVLVYGLYMMALNIISDRMNIAKEHDFYTKLALDWKVPNLRGSFKYEEENVTPFGTQKLSYPLFKRVGKSDIAVGKATITKRISTSNSYVEYDLPGKDLLAEFSFSYPEDPRNGKKLEAYSEANVWETLEMLHEGTVAELAFSTDRFMSPENLVKDLEPYDIDILWMPLHSGEFEEFDPSWGGSNDSLSVNNPIGLTGGRTASENFLADSLTYSLNQTSVEESKKVMLQHMETLLSEKPSSYYDDFLGLGYLNERHNYIKNKGFIVYGAVVTGPVKELLKLKDEETVRGEQLGEVELWNWEVE
ncbi:sigma factor regulator [Planomicrobium soli]|uniref:Sigma factor regulator n=1 Tax=Planomicrobium soli TaxID=1176648 RepID=A0A2P8GG66_9BACL|nr:anti-sigma factor [Planomicrobium soli]PSL32961.1 sigma factor regulator [Planomicrobium soli]